MLDIIISFKVIKKNLGKKELPTKFINLELFPAVTLYHGSESVRLNFDKDKWLFKEFGYVLEKEYGK
jgi:hypothetical protein